MVKWYNFGEFTESDVINADIMKDILQTAHSKTSSMRETPVGKLAAVLDLVGRRLADPEILSESRFWRSCPARSVFHPR